MAVCEAAERRAIACAGKLDTGLGGGMETQRFAVASQRDSPKHHQDTSHALVVR
jgi:hypothetical protein